jgi:hypothetical protein
MKRAIEVLVNGKRVGLLQARGGKPVGLAIGNLPSDHMRVWAHGSDDEEKWFWQMPDVPDGQLVSFRVIQAEPSEISTPDEVELRDPAEVAEMKRKSKELWESEKNRKNK